MSRGLWITLAVIGSLGALAVLVAAMVFFSYVSTKNQLVTKDEAVKAAWADTDVQLQRRADLIPNLVETVKGFTKEESTVFGDIANARAGMLNAQGPAGKIEANGRLDSAIGRLLLLTENYPQLRSSEQFMRLQDELAGTENRIGVARKRYNDALRDYNTFLRQVQQYIRAGADTIQASADAAGSGRVNARRALCQAVGCTKSSTETYAFPNPLRLAQANGATLAVPDSLQGGEASIRIYTVSGALVRELTGSVGAGSAGLVWDGRNAAGTLVASGTYFFVVSTGKGKSRGRVAVIR